MEGNAELVNNSRMKQFVPRSAFRVPSSSLFTSGKRAVCFIRIKECSIQRDKFSELSSSSRAEKTTGTFSAHINSNPGVMKKSSLGKWRRKNEEDILLHCYHGLAAPFGAAKPSICGLYHDVHI